MHESINNAVYFLAVLTLELSIVFLIAFLVWAGIAIYCRLKMPKPLNVYDITSGEVMTTLGPAKYVSYDSNTRMVTVEFDYSRLVELDGRDCYIEPMIDIRV